LFPQPVTPIVVGGTVIVATEHNLVYGLKPNGLLPWSVKLGHEAHPGSGRLAALRRGHHLELQRRLHRPL
jgi:hypothetical protein